LGEIRRAHAFQLGGFELREDIVPGFGFGMSLRARLFFAIDVGSAFASDPRLLGMRLLNLFAANGAACDFLGHAQR